MVPERKDKKVYFKCTKCDYKVRGKGEKEGYKLREKVSEKIRVKTTSLVSKPPLASISEEEKQQRLEEYYDVALDLIQEELEGGESEE